MDDFFGASGGKIDDLSSSGLSNDFNNISNNDIINSVDTNRIQPRQVATGVTRGTWRINASDGSYITIGVIPNTDNEFGIAFFDSSNQLVAKYLGTTDYKYDLDTNKNYYQSGKLPDDSYGAVFVAPDTDVEDVFS